MNQQPKVMNVNAPLRNTHDLASGFEVRTITRPVGSPANPRHRSRQR